ncbi:MAG: peptidyl-prolyl cis-trans isomerase [Ignavibacteria bacterium]
MKLRHFATLLLFLCAMPVAAKDAAKERGIGGTPAAARVNGIAIPMARLDDAVRAAVARGGADTPELRAALRSQLVAREVFRQEAVKRGWQSDPQVLEARDAAMIQRYLKDAVRPELVPEALVRARYDAIVGGLGEREFRFRLIALADEMRAKDLLAALKEGKADFAEAARRESLLPSRERGGEMDWLSFKTPAVEGRTQGLPLPVANVIAALPAGTLAAEPVPLQGGLWCLVRMEEVRPTRVPAFDEVGANLRRALEAQALEKATAELVARLIANANIQ